MNCNKDISTYTNYKEVISIDMDDGSIEKGKNLRDVIDTQRHVLVLNVW